MKKYQDYLKELKEKNPKMSHKDAQIKASELYQAEKDKAEADSATKAAAAAPKPKKGLSFDPDNIEAEIRKAGVNIHNIVRIGQSFDKEFRMIIAGKDGVNTKVYLDGPARVPQEGFFVVWI